MFLVQRDSSLFCEGIGLVKRKGGWGGGRNRSDALGNDE